MATPAYNPFRERPAAQKKRIVSASLNDAQGDVLDALQTKLGVATGAAVVKIALADLAEKEGIIPPAA